MVRTNLDETIIVVSAIDEDRSWASDVSFGLHEVAKIGVKTISKDRNIR